MNFAKIRIPEKWRDMRGSSQKKLKNREEKKFCLRQFPRADFRALDHQLEKENLQQPPLISFEILIIRHFLSLPTRWGYRCSLTSFWHFSPIFVLLKVTCLVKLFDRKLQVSKVNNVLKCDFLGGFQTQWRKLSRKIYGVDFICSS